MTQYSRSVESSTSTDVLVYELKDRVQQYQFASPMYHFLVIFRAFFIFIFCLQFDESNAINTFNLITNYEIILIVPQLVGKVAFEIISPILGTAQINAGRVVFNYSIIHYLLISILFFIGFGAYSRFNNLILFSLAPFSQAAISHLFEVGKAERWNMSQIIAALISPTLSICIIEYHSYSFIYLTGNDFYTNYPQRSALSLYVILYIETIPASSIITVPSIILKVLSI